MTPEPAPDGPPRDPLAAYAAGDPAAVRAARPPEPDDARWEAVQRLVQARLDGRREPPPPRHRLRLAAAVSRAGRATAAGGRPPRHRLRLAAAVVTAAAVLVATAFRVSVVPPARTPDPPAREGTPAAPAGVAVAPYPHEPEPDVLADFAVLPMAAADEVVLHRVPGDGWLPVGTDPLPGPLELATAAEVELDRPDPAWPRVTPAPGSAPMIFATKPR